MTTDTTENHPEDALPGHQNAADRNGGHPFKVTLRTLAGHSHGETVKPADTVAEVTAAAVRYFVHKGQLADGAYSLTLPRTGSDAELDPTATLHDVGVVDDDVLVLISRDPQVDG